MINPLATASVLVLFLAAWLLVAGIYRIVFAIRVRKQIQGEWLLILSGVLAVVLHQRLQFGAAHIQGTRKIEGDIGRMVRTGLAVFVRPVTEQLPLVRAFFRHCDRCFLHIRQG